MHSTSEIAETVIRLSSVFTIKRKKQSSTEKNVSGGLMHDVSSAVN